MNDHPDFRPDPSLRNMPEGTVVLDDLRAMEFVHIGEPGHAVIGLRLESDKAGSLIVPMTVATARLIGENLVRIAGQLAQEVS